MEYIAQELARILKLQRVLLVATNTESPLVAAASSTQTRNRITSLPAFRLLNPRSTAGPVSSLDNIPGIGPHRKRALLFKFGTVSAIRNASIEELTGVKGITLYLVEKLKEHLG
mgnify:CR=1 FL=1